MVPQDTKTYEGETGFTNIDEAMKLARAKYAKHPELLPDTTLPKYERTPEDKDFDERFGIAFAKTKRLIREGKAQLAAPVEAPEELTKEEVEEQAANDDWDFARRRSFRLVDKMLLHNQQLFDDVMKMIDEYEEPIPESLRDLQVHSSSHSPSTGWSTHIPDDVRLWIKQTKERAAPFQQLKEGSGSVIIDEVRKAAAKPKRSDLGTFLRHMYGFE